MCKSFERTDGCLLNDHGLLSRGYVSHRDPGGLSVFLCAIFSGLTGTQEGDCLREKGKSLWFPFLCEVKLLMNIFGKCLMVGILVLM